MRSRCSIAYGDIGVVPDSPEGMFLRDTRYLSLFELTFEGRRPLLLGSVLEDDNATLTADLTNPDVHRGEDLVFPRDIIAIDRVKLLYDGGCYEHVNFYNYDTRPRAFKVSFRFDADFRDLFEVRGMRRDARGKKGAKVVDANHVVLRYDGLDKVSRFTTIAFEPAPQRLDTGTAEFAITLEAGAKFSIVASVACAEDQADEADGVCRRL